MKTKKLTPRNVAPVKRDSVATASNKTEGGMGISPLSISPSGYFSLLKVPFAGDDAE